MQSLQYNVLGNITSKSDVGTYSYGASCTVNGVSVKGGIHAVTGMTGSQSVRIYGAISQLPVCDFVFDSVQSLIGFFVAMLSDRSLSIPCLVLS